MIVIKYIINNQIFIKIRKEKNNKLENNTKKKKE